MDLPIPGSASWRCPSLPPHPILGFAMVSRSFLDAGLPILGLASRRCPSLPPPPIWGFVVVGRPFHVADLPILGPASRRCPSLPPPPILGFAAVGRSFHWFLVAHPSSSRFAGGRRRPHRVGHRPYRWPYLYRLPYSIGSLRLAGLVSYCLTSLSLPTPWGNRLSLRDVLRQPALFARRSTPRSL